MIIGLTALPAAGKGTISAYLVAHYAAKTMRFSDPLRDAIRRFYQDPTRESMSHLGTFVRNEFGNDILIRTLLQDIEQVEAPVHVLDGMRMFDEYHVLSQRKDFEMWAVDTDIKKRYQRIIKRDENKSDLALTFEQFQTQHQLPTEVDMPKLLKRANVTIDNNGDLDTLYQTVDAQMERLGIAKRS